MTKTAADNRRYMNPIGVGIVLFLVATSVTMCQYKIPTIMVDIMGRFQVDAGAASWLMSIFTFVGIIVAIPTGLLAKRIGAKRTIILAIVINVVGQVGGAFASNVWILLLTRAFEGIALVFTVASAPLLIQRVVAPSRIGTSTGIYMLGGMLGATIGGVLSPTLFYSVGYMGLWLSFAAITAVSGIIFLAYVRREVGPLEVAAGESNSNDASEWRIFLKPNTLLFYAPFAIFQLVLLTILSYSPVSLQQQGMSAALSGVVSTLPMLLAIISSIAFGVISDKMGRCKPLCILGMLLLGPCCYIMLNCSGPTMWAALVIMGLTSMGTPTVFVAAYPTVLGKPELMSVGMGVLLLVQSLGQFLGTFISSALLGPLLDQWVLCGTVACVLALVGTLCVAVCKFR